jgi:hypothetical protein
VVQISGMTLVVSTTNGDVNVTYTAATPITQASTGPTADIVSGSCAVIVGTKDSTGAITATSVRLNAAVNGACANGVGARPGAGASFPPRPTGSAGAALPTPNPNAAFASGLVTAVVGTSVTVTPASGAAVTITVPTTIRVNESHPASASDLAVDICLLARGTKSASGAVAATALTIEPATANGTCTVVGFGGGGRGGFGGPGAGGSPPAGG